MYPQNQNNFQTHQNNYPGNNSWQNNNGENPTNSRMKKRIYTIIQIIAVIGLLISLPMLVLGIINVAPHLKQTEKTNGVITKISDDLGGIIDKSTNGRTELSSGCTINYEFNVASSTYKGFSHSGKDCNKTIGEKVPIIYSPSSPSDNSIETDTSFDTFLFWIGLALMIGNTILIIIFSTKKRQLIAKESQRLF